jgi:hypothetical protein
MAMAMIFGFLLSLPYNYYILQKNNQVCHWLHFISVLVVLTGKAKIVFNNRRSGQFERIGTTWS